MRTLPQRKAYNKHRVAEISMNWGPKMHFGQKVRKQSATEISIRNTSPTRILILGDTFIYADNLQPKFKVRRPDCDLLSNDAHRDVNP
jgi:hypothetical protein